MTLKKRSHYWIVVSKQGYPVPRSFALHRRRSIIRFEEDSKGLYLDWKEARAKGHRCLKIKVELLDPEPGGAPGSMPSHVWSDFDPCAPRGDKWAFYGTKADQRANRPDLAPIKLRIAKG